MVLVKQSGTDYVFKHFNLPMLNYEKNPQSIYPFNVLFLQQAFSWHWEANVMLRYVSTV